MSVQNLDARLRSLTAAIVAQDAADTIEESANLVVTEMSDAAREILTNALELLELSRNGLDILEQKKTSLGLVSFVSSLECYQTSFRAFSRYGSPLQDFKTELSSAVSFLADFLAGKSSMTNTQSLSLFLRAIAEENAMREHELELSSVGQFPHPQPALGF